MSMVVDGPAYGSEQTHLEAASMMRTRFAIVAWHQEEEGKLFGVFGWLRTATSGDSGIAEEEANEASSA
ncbi:hypothetical protein LTR91_005152 [Friedmanniomyces endolithicus]|uniref:Uncharacterized protein n=1 Tax=Friedmanniomyces endolithicus TaxID=329885 RepID=A0AAN6KTZ7_9PEZI|nr:hypothetical protein LTR94_000195 [Friedmanniomyces endolithicus]KAK0797284.1 hypothetical protein LTR59_006836 [Friedmanniomyces endolithicus]KAK0805227.1 hypothetical protein LTR75_007363 [Friedmanniomyces endolithicus]KAK0815141.1 hypothetical protein LTR38_002435 [Friedmanniomyces endolithicus]KAK0874408.1 hypothetical protein LTS02_000324 [Friedmanniomyces endolithicus]